MCVPCCVHDVDRSINPKGAVTTGPRNDSAQVWFSELEGVLGSPTGLWVTTMQPITKRSPHRLCPWRFLPNLQALQQQHWCGHAIGACVDMPGFSSLACLPMQSVFLKPQSMEKQNNLCIQDGDVFRKLSGFTSCVLSLHKMEHSPCGYCEETPLRTSLSTSGRTDQ